MGRRNSKDESMKGFNLKRINPFVLYLINGSVCKCFNSPSTYFICFVLLSLYFIFQKK